MKLWVSSQHHINQAWWYTPAILALDRWRRMDQKFMIILGYIENLRLAWDT